MQDGIETEFKLRGPQPVEVAAVDAALRQLACTISHRDSRTHVDLYLDDGERSLATAGIGLRLRRTGHRATLAVKLRGTADRGRFDREETEATWSGGTPPTHARELPDALRHRVEPFVLDRPLHAWLETDVERSLRVVRVEGRDVAEVAIDRVVARGGDRSCSFGEVEVEVHDDLSACEQLAAGLAARLGLPTADSDKPTHAADRLGIRLPAAGATPPASDGPLGPAIAARALAHLHAARVAEIGVRLELGPEPLHTLRVALRRLRGLVRAFRDLWPAEVATTQLTTLGDTARQLGLRRELDVMLASLPALQQRLPGPLQDGARLAIDRLLASRAAEQTRLVAWLGSPERLAATRDLESALASAASATALAEAPLRATAAARLARAAKNVRRHARALPEDLPTAPLHTLRLACKRLRYLAEEFEAVPGLAPKGPLARLGRLQRILGDVCDHEAAAAAWCDWIDAPLPPSAPAPEPRTIAALGALAALHQQAASKARRKARKRLGRTLEERPWRRFRAQTADDANLAS